MPDQRIKVEFPKDLKVHSSEIDSINSTTQRISNWLQKDFAEVIKPLQVLPQFPELINSFKTTVVEQFSNMFIHEMEAQMITRKANMKVMEKKLALIQDHISKKKKQFFELRDRIIQRYRSLTGKRVEQHHKYLRQLDSHAYDIMENIYSRQIQEKISYAQIIAANRIAAHTKESALLRHRCIEDDFAKTSESAEAFLDERQDFHEQLNGLAHFHLAEGRYELPLVFVQLENVETGEIETRFYWDAGSRETKNNLEPEEIEKFEAYLQSVISEKDIFLSDSQSSQLLDALDKKADMKDEDKQSLRNDILSLAKNQEG